MQLRVFGGEWGIRTPGGFYTPSAFKADAINQTLPTLQKKIDALFCFSHITKLAKTSHTCSCSCIVGFEPTFIHCRWICVWICCMRHINFTDSWLWSERRDSNPRPSDPKSGVIARLNYSPNNKTCIRSSFLIYAGSAGGSRTPRSPGYGPGEKPLLNRAWSRRRVTIPLPAVYKTAALPTWATPAKWLDTFFCSYQLTVDCIYVCCMCLNCSVANAPLPRFLFWDN